MYGSRLWTGILKGLGNSQNRSIFSLREQEAVSEMFKFMKKWIRTVIIQTDQFFQSRAGGLVIIPIPPVKGDVALFQIANLLQIRIDVKEHFFDLSNPLLDKITQTKNNGKKKAGQYSAEKCSAFSIQKRKSIALTL